MVEEKSKVEEKVEDIVFVEKTAPEPPQQEGLHAAPAAAQPELDRRE
jgi:hypothetical protein